MFYCTNLSPKQLIVLPVVPRRVAHLIFLILHQGGGG